MHPCAAKARRDEPGDAFEHGQVGAQIGARLADVGVEAPGHAACRLRLAAGHGQLGHHGLGGRELACAAEGRQDAGRADAGVEALDEAFRAGDVGVGKQRAQALLDVCGVVARHFGQGRGMRARGFRPAYAPRRLSGCRLSGCRVLSARGAALLGHVRALDARRSVGVQKGAVYVDDGLAVPAHAQARLGRDARDGRGLEVLLAGIGAELFHVDRVQHDGHALLAFRYGQLRAVEALVLARNGVQVDVELVGQLAHGHGNAARPEVVAALHQPRRLAAPEQPLYLALGRRIALLHLGAQGRDAGRVLRLARPGGPADAVASRAPAHEHDHISCRRGLADHVGRRGRAHDRADLHALGHVAGVVDLADLAGRQADLVAVAGVAGGRLDADLALRQLAWQGLGIGRARVAGAAHAHGLVDPGAPGQRVAYAAADAGGRPAEGLDFGGVVVRLVLEEDEPVLVAPVHVDARLHRAGVDLLGFVEVGQAPPRPHPARRDRAHVHERDGPPLAPELAPQAQIALEGRPHRVVVYLDALEAGVEGGVAAVVGPVGVDDAQLGDGGLAPGGGEMRTHAGQVCRRHGQGSLLDEGSQLVVAHAGEGRKRLDAARFQGALAQGLGQLGGGLAGLHGVYDIVLHPPEILVGEAAAQYVDVGRAHLRARAGADELDALGAGVGALVELAGQRLDGKGALVGRERRRLLGDRVHGRLGEDALQAALEDLVVYALDVVALHDVHALQARKTQVCGELCAQLPRLHVEAGFFLHEHASGHGFSSVAVVGWFIHDKARVIYFLPSHAGVLPVRSESG